MISALWQPFKSLKWLKEKVFETAEDEPNVPYCDKCGGVVRPDIVFFGESLPNRYFQNIKSDFQECDLLLVLGTSLTVMPFANLITESKSNVPRVYINLSKPGSAGLLGKIMGLGTVSESLRIPPLFAFWQKYGHKWSFGHSVIHGTTFDHFRSLWRHFKKFQKLLILRFLMSDLFFRNKYKPIVINLVYASKWWVTWLFLHNELENDHFDRFIGKYIPTSGLMVNLSRNDYFWYQCLLSFNLRCHTWHKLEIHRKSSKKL